MPIVLRVLIVVIATVVAALLLRAMLARVIRAELVAEADNTGDMVMEAMAGLYGVLVAFLLAGAWERYAELRGTFLIEAGALADLKQIADLMPSPYNLDFQIAIEVYQQTSTQEVAAVMERAADTATTATAGELLKVLMQFEPRTAAQTQLQSQAFTAIEQLVTQHRTRMLAARQTMPMIVWVILFGGAIILLVLVAIAGRSPIAAVYLALLAGLVSLALFAIYALMYPVRAGLVVSVVANVVQYR